MSDQTETSAKERILEAAIRLFARKSYSATGLREIVREAGVSVAMVNYHFGSKEALLQAIMSRFFGRMHAIAEENLTGEGPVELQVRRHFRAAVAFFRENPELVRVCITELPHDLPGIVEFKAEFVRGIVVGFATRFLPSLPEPARSRIRPEIFGPSVMGALTSHFILRPVIEKAFDISFDDSFYDNFADEMADMILYGVLRDSSPESSPEKG
jgi:AcrR family transcriptional regulator